MKGLGAAALIGLLAVLFIATEASGATKVVAFDDLAPDTTVSNQYRDSHGVFFRGPEQADGAFPVIKTVSPGLAHSGSQVADISYCPGCEFYTPRTVGRLTITASQVGAFVGYEGSADGSAQAQVTLIARNAAGQSLGTSSATVVQGQPFSQHVTVTSPGATIASFELVADPPNMSQPIGFDDLSLTYPDTGSPPDFALEVGSGPVRPAPAVDVPIRVNRLNGSNGDVTLSASGVPSGVSASFSPNPVQGTGAAATLRLSAVPNAAPSGTTEMTITGTPGSGAGLSPRTVKLAMRIVADCEGSRIAVGPATASLRVFSAAELDKVLRSDYRGRVVVPSGEDWDMVDCQGKALRQIPLQPGVELVGEAGALGRRPVLHTDVSDELPLFVACGDLHPEAVPACDAGTGDVRVEGLHLRGPYRPKDRDGKGGVDAISVVRDPARQQGRVVISDNEIDGFKNAVNVRGLVQADKASDKACQPDQVDEPCDYDDAFEAYYGVDCPQTCPHPDRGDATLVRVENNYIHNEARVGGGYGVVVGGAAYARVTGNVFEFNNHSIAASGRAYSGYLAHYNYLLKGALDKKDHHFDVHGTKSGNHAGGDAGTFFDISFNTIRGEQTYAGGFKTRAVFGLRGRPTEGARFHDNVFVHDGYGEAIKLVGDDDKRLDEDRPSTFRLRYYDNKADTDYSTEIAAGDFDGDGRTDVFVANGTGWFFSPAGIRPWEFLDASRTRTKDLAFADVDNDRITDVIFQRPSGKLGYLKRGPSAAVTLPSSPVPPKDLRFGDFDGDGLTDIFYTRNRQWHVWYGSTRAWTDAGSSVTPVSEMLFGEFDEVRGTDVAAVRNNQWSYSSGATEPWARLNSKRVNSFAKAVAADFDGNGKSDIAFSTQQKWRYSADGRGPLTSLRNGSAAPAYAPLNQLLIGRFDGGTRAMVLSWKMVPRLNGFLPEWQFVIWRGLGSAQAFAKRSEQNMR